MTRAVIAALSVAAIGVLAGCPFSISSRPIEGTIGGEPWLMEQGEAWRDDDDGTYSVELYPELYVDCMTPPANASHLLLDVPDEVGEFELGEAGFSVEFVAFEEGGKVRYGAVRARIEVLELEGTRVVAGLHARHSDANDVDGRFDVSRCD